MDHAASMRRAYELISAGDMEEFGKLVADDFVEHETTPMMQQLGVVPEAPPSA
jgi:ketosteroid isomerase-like protein